MIAVVTLDDGPRVTTTIIGIDADDVRRWKRPRWPLWLLTLLLLALLGWVAMVLGGFIDAPAWFRPVAQWWWNRGWA